MAVAPDEVVGSGANGGETKLRVGGFTSVLSFFGSTSVPVDKFKEGLGVAASRLLLLILRFRRAGVGGPAILPPLFSVENDHTKISSSSKIATNYVSYQCQ